uniref:Neogenin C-terminal domain-containing protein n=1 Tax=Knipowitschia caucasica TaxID=637954 RepID=A0AAV2LVG1_KNICA
MFPAESCTLRPVHAHAHPLKSFAVPAIPPGAHPSYENPALPCTPLLTQSGAPSHPHVVKTASIGTLGRTRTPMIVTVPNAPDVPETSRMLEDVDSVQVSQVQDISCSLCLSISPSPCPPNLTDLGLPLSPSPPSSPLALLQVLASLTPSSASRSNAPPPVPLPQSYEPDELTEEMAHLEGLMKDLNAITTAP